MEPENRANEIPDSLLNDLEEHDQEERKQMAENINKKNKERLEERKQRFEEDNRSYTARKPTPEVADGHINAMPAITIDACYDERRLNKSRFLSKPKDNHVAGQSEVHAIITPRLSKPDMTPSKNFSVSFNAINCSHMERYKEARPERHQQLTKQL